MIELGGGQGFADEPAASVLAQEHFRPGDLQRDLALQLGVISQKHNPAAALAQLPAQLEAADPGRAGDRDRRGRQRGLPRPQRVRLLGIGQHFAQRRFMSDCPTQRGHQALAG